MAEKEYKCGYTHCLYPQEKVKASEVVIVGKRRFHKECAELHAQVERIKRIYFDHIDSKSDYVQVLGVINTLIFKSGYSADFIEFVMKYVVVYCTRIKSPYILHTIVSNGITEKMFKDDKKRMEVSRKFDSRTGTN